MIWLFLAALSLAVLAFLVWPLLRAGQEPQATDEKDYLAAQLLDIERDRKADILSEEDAAIADLEARRRLLSAARADETKKARGASPMLRQAAVLLVGAIPVAALALYFRLGDPDLEPTRLAQEIGPTAQQPASSLAESIAALEARLKENPDDLNGWMMLAEAYASLNRFGEAAASFARAAALAPDRAYLHAALGEALAMANGGVISEESSAALKHALSLDPNEPRALFYSALEMDQAGDGKSALDALVALANGAPEDASWIPIVNREISRIAGELGTPPEDAGLNAEALARFSAPTPRSPSSDAIAAAQSMTDEQRLAMIAGMVDGLAARLEQNPDDLEGWLMLGRSYSVLGRYDDSVDAFARAVALSPDNVGVRVSEAQAMLARLDAQGEPIDAPTEAALAEILKRDAAQPFALFFLGVAAQQANDPDAAKAHWSKLLAELPPGSEEAARVRELISALPAAR